MNDTPNRKLQFGFYLYKMTKLGCVQTREVTNIRITL